MIRLLVPRILPLGSRRYKVVLKNLRDEGFLGTISHDIEPVVEIDPGPCLTRRAITFWHENIHGIKETWHLDMSEADIDRLSEGLNQVLQDGFGIELDWSDIEVVK